MNILRFAIRLALVIAYTITKQLRYKWLNHYLSGKGQEMYLPSSVMEEILPNISNLCRNVWEDEYDDYYNELVVKEWNEGNSMRILFGHSTIYEGSGFSNRPEAFYLVGGFTFNCEISYDSYHQQKMITIRGADRYDWHDDEDGNWFTSPLPIWLTRILGSIFGRKYFPTSGFPLGEPGVSNQLWFDMTKYGAKDFRTKFNFTCSYDDFIAASNKKDEMSIPVKNEIDIDDKYSVKRRTV